MRRTARQKRRPTVDDLNETHRRIYESIPAEELREAFLNSLPPISTSTAGTRKKAQLIRDRANLVDDAIRQLQEHKRQLLQLAKSVEQGAPVDLRTELKLPDVRGISLRYVRGRKDD